MKNNILSEIKWCRNQLATILEDEDLDDDKLREASEGLLPNVHDRLNALIQFGTEPEDEQKKGYIEGLKKLLRFADCPEILIENPSLLDSRFKPEDIAWAKNKAHEYDSKETSAAAIIRRVYETLIRHRDKVEPLGDNELYILLGEIKEVLDGK